MRRMTSLWDRPPNELTEYILRHRAAIVVQERWRIRCKQQEALYVAVTRKASASSCALLGVDSNDCCLAWLHSKVRAVCNADLRYYVLYIHLSRDL